MGWCFCQLNMISSFVPSLSGLTEARQDVQLTKGNQRPEVTMWCYEASLELTIQLTKRGKIGWC